MGGGMQGLWLPLDIFDGARYVTKCFFFSVLQSHALCRQRFVMQHAGLCWIPVERAGHITMSRHSSPDLQSAASLGYSSAPCLSPLYFPLYCNQFWSALSSSSTCMRGCI
jgi:hypothetical protein